MAEYPTEMFRHYVKLTLVSKLIDEFQPVPEPLKISLQEQLSTGFVNWTKVDYEKFIKAFEKYDFGDIEGI